ncbi:OstA-like protein [Aquirufa sp.]|jgi:lipopolysaccharide export system protein LptA|uniref:OstA-like protein n=1 Tax=Aquirufa sp. TaxID=2676249 RepID=UPI003783B4C7
MRYKGWIFLVFLLSLPFFMQAQGQLLQVIRADSLIGMQQELIMRKTLMGRVLLQQGTTTLFCDQAVLNSTTNNVEAYGHVRIIQADTVTITGDTALYNGNMRQAYIIGRVKLDDHTILLNTPKLDYDLNTKMAIYHSGAKIIDKKSTLTSREGFYNTVTKNFLFKEKVKVIDTDGGTVKADSLKYNTASKEAYFIAPTEIVTKKDTVLTSRGFYNTVSKVSNFTGRSTAKTDEYILTADTLFYDSPTQIGVAKGKVEFLSQKEKVILKGDNGRYAGKTGVTRVYGHAWMQNIMEKDTLYLTADTLVSINIKKDSIRKLFAYKNVLIYKSDLSGKCDSLGYNVQDSIIHFYQKPILWTQDSQSQADSISLFMGNQKLKEMRLRGKSFVISIDSLKQFNQIKGRKIWVHFKGDSQLNRVNVEGNGESIYYVIDDKKETTGLNRVECSRMNLFFEDKAVKRIAFITKPEAKFIPPKEWKEDLQQLDGFRWRISEKPYLQTILKRVEYQDLVKKP